MASNITFTSLTGASTAIKAARAFTIYSSYTAADAVDAHYSRAGLQFDSPPAHQIVPFPGNKDVSAKHMGGATNRILIAGYITDKDNEEAVVMAAALTLLGKNKINDLWEVKIGNTKISSAGGARIDTISVKSPEIGGGPNWSFVIPIVNLSADD